MTADLERKHEHFLHQKTAQHLAEELQQSEASVRKAYAAELRKLQRVARVKQFLPVLTAKHVKARYRHEWEQARARSSRRPQARGPG